MFLETTEPISNILLPLESYIATVTAYFILTRVKTEKISDVATQAKLGRIVSNIIVPGNTALIYRMYRS